ncbi:MAG TPA: hypothetical protein VKB57_12855 [Acidimicrobiales bacterium]|nr:hypothetical protein [Acidimicrobiales bacterium]
MSQNGNNNNSAASRSRRRRNNRKQSTKPVDLWRPVPPLAPPAPITPAGDPTALVRSLGDPPLPGQGPAAELAIAAVVDRAAGLATALAATGGLLAMHDEDPTTAGDE